VVWRKSIWIVLIFFIFAASVIAAAENSENQTNKTEVGNDTVQWGTIFPWHSTSGDWREGILLALSGLMGALVTIYGLIGTAMPGTSGKASLEVEEIRLESFKKKLSELWKKEEKDINIEAAKELEIATTNLQAYISKERWRQFGLAAFLYVILGAFFAVLLSESFLQALAIGAGWTAYLGVVGLRKDSEVRGSIKDREIEELERNVKNREQRAAIMEKSLKESQESIDKLAEESKKKTRVLYALKKIQEGEDIYLLEGTKKSGPWYRPGQFNPERLTIWENQGKIDYTEI